MRFPRLRLPARGWKRWLALLGVAVGSFILLLLVLAASLFAAVQNPAVQKWIFEKSLDWDPPTPERLAQEPAPRPVWKGEAGQGGAVRSAEDLYRWDRVWNISLSFNAAEWDALQHRRRPPMTDWLSDPSGQPKLRSPDALRNGLAGVLGFDQPWSTGRVSIGGVVFTNAGVRFKGNGTFLESLRSYRRPFKVDLSKHQKGRSFGGRRQFNLGNLAADTTCMADLLGYAFFRDAGVPAPRTALGRVFLDVEGRETNRFLGPYVLVENPDSDWALERFGVPRVALFKPVTHGLFADLGTNWSDYDGIYDPKTSVSDAQKARLMETARFVTQAPDAEFASRLAEFFDVEEMARFLACEVMLSNYDGILSNGQNFLMYLHPGDDRFGFIPWDLDHSWGEFPFLGTDEERAQAGIRHPWVGPNRFLERVFAVEAFQRAYRSELERLLSELFTTDRLYRRMDAVAAALDPLVAEWSPMRLRKLRESVSLGERSGDVVQEGATEGRGGGEGGGRPAWRLKRFVRDRAQSVRAQLDGRSEGLEVRRHSLW
ncbi:MAG: CotH kinase family protein [Limisphaerales bacterium]